MNFTNEDFKEILSSDIWLIKNMLTLPSDPPPRIEVKENNEVIINLHDTISMPDQQRAVKKYQSNLLPVIYSVTQKVYSELFRVLLSSNNLTAGWKQYDVETKIRQNSNNILNYSPFNDQNDYQDWWEGKYNFRLLRKTRNKIMHDQYQLTGGILRVNNDGELFEWNTEDILRFAEEVLVKAKSI